MAKVRKRLRRALGSRVLWAGFGTACLAGGATHLAVGCNGWDPRDPFQHNAPAVEKALAQIDGGDFVSAEQILSDYLGTGVCDKGKLGIPESVRQKADGTFDMGVILFYLGEKYGRVFGDEEKGDPDKDNPEEMKKRSDEIDCAQLVLGAIANDEKVPIELRARAAYLEGNLEFLRREYEAAVRFYDHALRLVPGIIEEAGGDSIGRDAAWNRAIALRRIEDKKDAGGPDADADDGADGNDGADGSDAQDAQDAQPDGADGADGNSGPDASDGSDGNDAGDAGTDAGGDAGDAGKDAGADADPQDNQDDAGEPDGGQDDNKSPPQAPSAGPPQPSDPQEEEQQQQDRLLDKFEGTPTYQQQEAKRRTGGRRTMEDK
jgi:hypothetical protein